MIQTETQKQEFNDKIKELQDLDPVQGSFLAGWFTGRFQSFEEQYESLRSNYDQVRLRLEEINFQNIRLLDRAEKAETSFEEIKADLASTLDENDQLQAQINDLQAMIDNLEALEETGLNIEPTPEDESPPSENIEN
jgi:septal ring factor EnvC (AmiA/AmiB activator)